MASRRGPLGSAHAPVPKPRDEGGRRLVATIEKDRADERLAHVGEDRDATAPAGIALRSAKPDSASELDRLRHVGASLLAHQIGQPSRQLPFVGTRKGAKEHVGNDKAEHVIAKELEPLIAAGSVAHTAEGRNMRQRMVEQRRIGKTIADAGLERAGAAARPLGRARLGLGLRGNAVRPTRGLEDRGSVRLVAVAQRFGSLAGGRAAFASRPAAHRTSLNSRPQRTFHGQVHTAHACSPWIEKKIIWARPMMFSSGT